MKRKGIGVGRVVDMAGEFDVNLPLALVLCGKCCTVDGVHYTICVKLVDSKRSRKSKAQFQPKRFWQTPNQDNYCPAR
jgi:hypothetical protein